MKTKNILLLFIVFLFGCGYLSAQQRLFYYYKGNPIPLNVNSQHFLVYADANKISMEELNKEFKITEAIETGQNGILEVQETAISNHESQFTHQEKTYFCQINS